MYCCESFTNHKAASPPVQGSRMHRRSLSASAATASACSACEADDSETVLMTGCAGCSCAANIWDENQEWRQLLPSPGGGVSKEEGHQAHHYVLSGARRLLRCAHTGQQHLVEKLALVTSAVQTASAMATGTIAECSYRLPAVSHTG